MAEAPIQNEERMPSDDAAGESAGNQPSQPRHVPPAENPEGPEPPANWSYDELFPDDTNTYSPIRTPTDKPSHPALGAVGKQLVRLDEREAVEFGSARNYVVASQVAAIVSLFVGGMVLSAVAVVLAILGYRRLSAIAERRYTNPGEQRAIKRSGLLAIVMSVLAFVVNGITVAVLYPAVMQAVQQGDLGALFDGARTGAVVPGPSDGTSLFG